MTSDHRTPLPGAGGSASLRARLAEAALVGLLALVLNLAGNGRFSLWDRDEPRYAGCTREMRRSGDYIHPTFNAEPRYHKPILIYWLMLGGTALGGDNPFGARLVSALAGTGTCLLVWAWGRRYLGARAGLLAGLILATTPIMVAESKLATTDATLTFFVVGCQLALWELARRPSRGIAAAFWVSLGLAILTKAPAGPALIVVAGIASWWWGGPTACWRRLGWPWGPALCALVVVPWNVAILLRSGGAYYDVAVGYHIIQRLTRGIEEHGGFPGYYLATSLVTGYPWSALLPAALAGAWLRRQESPIFGFLLGWIAGPLLFLECVRTKLIHYYLPSFPACALLVAWLVVALTKGGIRLRHWPLGRASFGLLTGIGAVGTTGLLVAAVAALPELRIPCLALALLLGAGTSYAARHYWAGQTVRATNGLIATLAAIALLTGTWFLPAAEPYRLAARVGRRLAAHEAREQTSAVLCGFKPPGVIYALGHPAPIIRDTPHLIEHVEREGKALLAVYPSEVERLRENTQLAVEILETLRGFNIEKARKEKLHLVIVRPDRPAVVAQSRPSSRKRPMTREPGGSG